MTEVTAGDCIRRLWEAAVPTAAVFDVLQERNRQQSVEGFTIEHDDAHSDRGLLKAAQAYVEHVRSRSWTIGDYGAHNYQTDPPPICWPWERSWWKPKDSRRDLVRAAALLLAELERMDRASPLTQGEKL